MPIVSFVACDQASRTRLQGVLPQVRPALLWKIGLHLAMCYQLLCLPQEQLVAQVVEVRVVDSLTTLPAASAIVSLQRADGTVVERRLTDLLGLVRFAGMGVGEYRLEVDRIGARRQRTSVFGITSPLNTIRRRVVMATEEFVLPDLDVLTDEVACSVGGVGGRALVSVWEEARKALTATVLTQESVRPLLRRWRWERSLDRNQRPRGERDDIVEYTRGAPFVSVPIRRLREIGFVDVGPDYAVFSLPDAHVLLADGFLDAHCFRLEIEERRQEGLVGLRFAPLADRKVSEVEGALWLRRRGAELVEITFRYVNLPPVFEGNPKFGGRVVFDPIPGVGWIVREWSVQSPLYGVPAVKGSFTGRRRTTGLGIVRWHLAGGRSEVVRVDTALAEIDRPSPNGAHITSGFTRPQLCGPIPRTDESMGLVVVKVERADSTGVVPNLPVLVTAGDPEFQAVQLANGKELRVERAATRVDGVTDGDGILAVCGIPLGTRVVVHAGSDVSPPTYAVSSNDPSPIRVQYTPVAPTIITHAGVLAGRVVDTAGVAVPDVQVVLVETGRFATTDTTGRYRVTGVPVGRFEVMFRRFGYLAVRTFRSFRQDTLWVNIRLTPLAFVLPEVEADIRGPVKVPPKLREWARRRAFNVGGKFWDDSLMRTLEHRKLPEVLQGVPRVRIIRGPGGERYVATSGGGSPRQGPLLKGVPSACYVEIYLDGARLSSVGYPVNLDDIPVQMIAAMEFYRSVASMPVEFNSPGSSCGVLAIWTR